MKTIGQLEHEAEAIYPYSEDRDYNMRMDRSRQAYIKGVLSDSAKTIHTGRLISDLSTQTTDHDLLKICEKWHTNLVGDVGVKTAFAMGYKKKESELIRKIAP